MVRSAARAGSAVVHRPQAFAGPVLAENRRRYELLVETVEHHARAGDAERVLRTAVMAANYAWEAHVGLLSDLRLERAVVHAARGTGIVGVDGGRQSGRVLHVLSETYAIGGHTRQVCAWMARDERTSDVVLTNQQVELPDRLVDAVHASGGQLHDLRATTTGLMDRARALRAHMDAADVVVLTVHPWDSVALAAVNLPGVRPPVIYANHADHSFWLGVGSADVLCDWRVHARVLDVAERGMPAERVAVLPLPMDAVEPGSADGMRERLGIAPGATVAVTVGADWKVAPAWGRGLHHVVDRVLHWSPDVTVVLVGISPTAEWSRLARRYPGRVLPMGTVPNAEPFLALADVFLECYPVRAGTTPLEAAMAGLPVVALADIAEDDPARIFHTGSPGLDEQPTLASAEQVALAVRRLARDADLRRREGDAVRRSVEALHDGAGWRAQLEDVYDHARLMTPIDVDALTGAAADERYHTMLLCTTSGGQSPDPTPAADPLGDLFDPAMQADLFAAFHRHLPSPLSLRVAAGWAEHPDWMSRLIELAARESILRVSIPFLPDDDVAGSRTTAVLLALIERAGSSAEGCGNINVETVRPSMTPSISDELPFTDEAFAWLERLVCSPCWVPLPGFSARTELAAIPA